jgi:hypothetical protein
MTSWSSFGVKARTCSTNCRLAPRRRRLNAHYRRTAPLPRLRQADGLPGRATAIPVLERLPTLRVRVPPPRSAAAPSSRTPPERRRSLRERGPADGCLPRLRRISATAEEAAGLLTTLHPQNPPVAPNPDAPADSLQPVRRAGLRSPGRSPAHRPLGQCRLQVKDAELEAEREQAIAAALAEGTRTCRGCGGRYRPAWPNHWCSKACLGEYMDQCRDSQECPGCGASTENLPLSVSKIRKWCSITCRRRAIRWRAEFRERARHPPRHLSFQARQTLIRNRYQGAREYQPNWSRSSETNDESPPVG